MNQGVLKAPITTNKEIITPEEAAELLRVSTRTVYELLRSGKLPAMQFGRQWRIKTADVLPRSATDSLESSMELYLKGDFQTAIYRLEEVIKQTPHYGLAYWLLGTIYGYYGHYHEAARVLEESIRLHPEYVPSHHNLGIVYNYIGDHRAIDVLTTAIKLDPENADSYYQLGYAYLYRGRQEETIKYLTEAIRRDPNHLKAREFLVLTYWRMGDEKAAKREDAILQSLIAARNKEREADRKEAK